MCTFHPQQISCIYLIGFLTSKLPTTAPEKGEDWNKIFNDVEELIVPGVCEININYVTMYNQQNSKFSFLLW